MAIGDPPVNVGELVLKVTKSTKNIAAHRAAMAEVAAAVKVAPPIPPSEGVIKP